MAGQEDESLNRRQVLQSIGVGAASLGLTAVAGAEAANGNGKGEGPGNNPSDGSGNNGNNGNNGGGNAPRGHIVGTSSEKAKDEAAQRAKEVRHVFDFGDAGQAVAGKFPEQARKGLEQRPDVRYIEEDGQMEAIGETTPWGVDRIDADTAHTGGITGAGADIAILDTGIDSDHADLTANLGSGKAYVECGTDLDGSDCSGNGNTCNEPWDDDNDHGTHCAGTADAVDNSDDVVGVGTEATLHPIKVLACSGSGYFSDIAAGIEYTADQGWDVASLSLGASSGSSTIRDACQYATDNGVLVVAAAGNEGPCSDCVQYPAKYSSVVAVSATTDTDSLADFSSTGPEIELAAPGETILSTIPGGTAYYSGTSMACPHVSGAGALLMANGYSNTEARSQLGDTTEDIGLADNEQGNGLLDAEAATSSSIGETGTIEVAQSGADKWHQITLDGTYADPIVVMKPPSYDGGHPSHVRLRNVGSDRFEFQIEEWKYLDGGHTSETMCYLVIEAGTHELSDGTLLEADRTTAQTNWIDASFAQSFSATPVVFSQSQTYNGNHPVVTRNKDVSTGGFDVKLQEEEGNDGWHTDETVGYIAISPNTGTNGSTKYEVHRTANTVTNDWHTVSFDQSYASPLLVTDIQTVDGWQPAGVRYRNLTSDGVEIFIEEERSDDDEMYHTSEVVGLAVFDGGGSISGT